MPKAWGDVDDGDLSFLQNRFAASFVVDAQGDFGEQENRK
jgi:hypothetical protein